jgi:uncharacterized membrane protein YkoI
MKRVFFLICIACAVGVLLAPASLAAGRGGGGGLGGRGRNPDQKPDSPSNSGDQEIAPLPPAVRKTAEAEAGRGKIVDAERATEDGEPVYEVTIGYGYMGQRNLTIAPDGTLLARQVAFRMLPSAVKQTIISFERFGGSLGDIYMTFEDGDISYAVEALQAQGKRFFTVGLDGTHEATQVHMNEIPPAVQKAILAQAAGGNVFNIDRSEVDGGNIFNVLMIQGGKRRTVSIDTEGAVVGTQVYLPEIPPQCQMGITKQAAGAKIGYIERSVEDGQLQFDVTTMNNGEKKEFVVGKDGKLLSTVVPLSKVPEVVKSAIRDKTTGGRITRVDQLADEPAYDVEVERDGKKRTVTVTADGKVE